MWFEYLLLVILIACVPLMLILGWMVFIRRVDEVLKEWAERHGIRIIRRQWRPFLTPKLRWIGGGEFTYVRVKAEMPDGRTVAGLVGVSLSRLGRYAGRVDSHLKDSSGQPASVGES